MNEMMDDGDGEIERNNMVPCAKSLVVRPVMLGRRLRALFVGNDDT